jgi:virulence-associated protein VagC
MTKTQVLRLSDGQAVRIPLGFEFAATEAAIRREGAAVILEPIKPESWPVGFFEQIRVDDPAFCRPEQGTMPAAPDIA